MDQRHSGFAFVLMPFDSSFDDVYQLGIRAACEAVGITCQRVDEQIFQETILERIRSQIESADFIIAEMTGRNVNVFYEVGFAHALQKTVIHVTQRAEDIPFDLKPFPHIIYGGSIAHLKSELVRRIPAFISPLTSKKTEPEIEKGTVRWFNDTKGYGLIIPDSGGRDVFVHHSAIIAKGFRSLCEGERVEFQRVLRPQGPAALQVRKIE